jgi:hypothetical protein
VRLVDVLTSQGLSLADAIRQIGVSDVTYYQRGQQYGALAAAARRSLWVHLDHDTFPGSPLYTIKHYKREETTHA